ncbi:PaaI family thioesterase [Paracoccus sp. PXZ]|uniref:PaaI family thioesterase n=1 Tax=Paracoccus sp. MKU1 TaxID=1745182 RepID=UPI00071939F6|nr:PaaI family thioesterase [Paracoccus sp. MKU1]KRW98043.1 phenylacetic acid degradation protein [Paracoccus sp. MKU1]
MHDSQTPATIELHSPYSGTLGMETVAATLEEVVLRMPVTQVLTNRNGVLHGGAIMSLADHAAGTATHLRLPAGAATTTLESKTNFLRPLRLGDVAEARSRPLHLGRTMMIWQTDIFRGDGKLAAVVIQTQLVLEWKDPA